MSTKHHLAWHDFDVTLAEYHELPDTCDEFAKVVNEWGQE